MDVLLVDRSSKLKQIISISKIDDVSDFLSDISKEMQLLEKDSYYYILFKGQKFSNSKVWIDFKFNSLDYS